MGMQLTQKTQLLNIYIYFISAEACLFLKIGHIMVCSLLLYCSRKKHMARIYLNLIYISAQTAQ